MAQGNPRLPSLLSEDLTASLGSAVKLAGPLDDSSRRKLKSAADNLERSLRNYERINMNLLATTPLKEQLDKVISDRVPSNYRNKNYKRFFWRMVYNTVPFLTEKKKTEDQVNELSSLALSSFSVIFRAIVAYSNAFLAQSVSLESESDVNPEDPDTFDPELDDALLGLEREIKPSRGSDKEQRDTNLNIKRDMRRTEPMGSVSSPEEFRDFVGKNDTKVAASRDAIKDHSDDLEHVLKWSTSQVFSTIQQSAQHAVVLGQVLTTIIPQARENLVPGNFVVCKSILATVLATNEVIVQSVAQNSKQRKLLNNHLNKLETGIDQIMPGDGEE